MKLEKYLTEKSDFIVKFESGKLRKCEALIEESLQILEKKIAELKQKTGDKTGVLEALNNLREIHKALEEGYMGVHKARVTISKIKYEV